MTLWQGLYINTWFYQLFIKLLTDIHITHIVCYRHVLFSLPLFTTFQKENEHQWQ